MSILRTSLPKRSGEEDSSATMGDQFEWGAGIPMLYRALANGPGTKQLLKAPEPAEKYDSDSDPISHACSYWAALLHLLTFSFGWTQPALGLLRWLRAESPGDDARLRLLAQSYRRDRQLGALLDWLLTSPTASIGVWSHLARSRGRSAELVRSDTRVLLALMADQFPAAGTASPAPSGGSDPLHLGSHLHAALDRGNGSMSILDSAQRSATFTSPSMSGWYEALSREGDALQSDQTRSWRVEVFVDTVGPLGTYRRSRTTNIWFSGAHRYHLWGQ